MLVRTTLGDRPATVSLTDRALTASVDDRLVVAWDLAGRLYSVVDDDRTSRRGLNGRVQEKWRENAARQRRWLTDAEADALVDRVAALARQLLDRVSSAGQGVPAPPALSGVEASAVEGGLAGSLERAARFDRVAARADAAAFASVYRPIGILPPDQYLSLVLQATEGCSFRSCTFCEFYRDPYRVKSAGQFASHVSDVRRYLGDSLRLRGRAIFLGSANALAVPMQALVPIFEVIHREFGGRPVNAFLDGFTGTLKTVHDYRELAEGGLRRVYVGLESGHDALLAFVQKPATAAQAIDTVRAIKAAGVSVGVIVMVGLGGERFADDHVRETVAAVNAMELGEADLLYFSELVAWSGSPYAQMTEARGIRALTPEERSAQRYAIENALRFGRTRPKIATYDVREFVY